MREDVCMCVGREGRGRARDWETGTQGKDALWAEGKVADLEMAALAYFVPQPNT